MGLLGMCDGNGHSVLYLLALYLQSNFPVLSAYVASALLWNSIIIGIYM